MARELKELLSSQLSLLFDLMAHLARKGREPYAILLAQGCEVTAELNQVAKTRETREKRAEEKRKKAQQAQAPEKESVAAPPIAAPRSTVPTSSSGGGAEWGLGIGWLRGKVP